MKLIDRIALNRLISIIADLIISLAKIFAKGSSDKTVNPVSPVKPHKPKPLKRVVDTIDNIIPFPWRNK